MFEDPIEIDQSLFQDIKNWPLCPNCERPSLIISYMLARCSRCNWTGNRGDIPRTDLTDFLTAKSAMFDAGYRSVNVLVREPGIANDRVMGITEQCSQLNQRASARLLGEILRQRLSSPAGSHYTLPLVAPLENISQLNYRKAHPESLEKIVALSWEDVTQEFTKLAERTANFEGVVGVYEISLMIPEAEKYRFPASIRLATNEEIRDGKARHFLMFFNEFYGCPTYYYIEEIRRVKEDGKSTIEIVKDSNALWLGDVVSIGFFPRPACTIWQPIHWDLFFFIPGKIQPRYFATMEICEDINVNFYIAENLEGGFEAKACFRTPGNPNSVRIKTIAAETAEEAIEKCKAKLKEFQEQAKTPGSGDLVFAWEKEWPIEVDAYSILNEVRTASFWHPGQEEEEEEEESKDEGSKKDTKDS